jgi:hypothetical protein
VPGARFVRSDEPRAARSSELTNLPPGADLTAAPVPLITDSMPVTLLGT